MKWMVFALFLVFGLTAFPQGKSTVEFKAAGCCGMCADRIEGALDVSGVRVAEWDREEKAVFVVYKPKKISAEAIEELVAGVGHDTEHFLAEDEVYASLAGCCQYRDGCPGCSEVHGEEGESDHDHPDQDDDRKP
jgi:mercuric ion binding protein